MDRKDLILVLLPWPLSVIPFRLASEEIILSMAFVSSSLGILAVLSNREILGMIKLGTRTVLHGLLFALILYILFLIGHMLVILIGLGGQIEFVYSNVRKGPLELILLPIIGFMEEVYWRGYLQETLIGNKLRGNWILSAIPYALVHITPGLIAIVLAAGVAGLIFGLTARIKGLTSSIITHITWLYIILYIAPTYKILGI